MKAARRCWSFSGLLAASGLIGFAAITRAAVAPNAQATQTHAAQSGRSTPAVRPLVTAVTRVDIVVRDLARSRPFFELLGFTPVREEVLDGDAEAARTGIAGARVRQLELALGDERLALRQFLAPAGAGRPVPPDSRGNDRWFQHVALVVSDMDRAYAWLRKYHVAHVSSGPQTLPAWNRAAGGIRAFYFADPDGHALEQVLEQLDAGPLRRPERRDAERCREDAVEALLLGAVILGNRRRRAA